MIGSLFTQPEPTVLTEMREIIKLELIKHKEEIEKRLSEVGLKIGDIPDRLTRIDKQGYPILSTYLFEDKPLFETKMTFIGHRIIFEIMPL